MIRRRAGWLVGSACCALLGACGVERLIGGMAQNYEYSKQIEVHPAYGGLDNRTVAVLVNVDMATQFEYPQMALQVAANVASRLQHNVPGVRLVPPQYVAEWQFRTPQWEAMPFGELAEKLGVDRVVHVDITEYRLHPPGNQYLWEGACTANVGVIERDGLDPDTYADVFSVTAEFPGIKGVTLESATARQVETGLQAMFVRKTGWLFYRHLEPKYPDKYNGPIEEGRYDG